MNNSSSSRYGRRYTCFKCSCKFYDLNKPEPLCPQCGTDQREDPTPDPRTAILSKYKGTGAPQKAKTPAPRRPDDLEDDDIDMIDDEDFMDDEDEPEGDEPEMEGGDDE